MGVLSGACAPPWSTEEGLYFRVRVRVRVRARVRVQARVEVRVTGEVSSSHCS